MFEGGKCNPIFLFIFLNVESFSGGGNRKSARSEKKTNSAVQEEKSRAPQLLKK